MQLVTWFDPQPRPDELPVRFPSPFGAPHPLARRAAERMLEDVRRVPGLDAPGGGKMFGVLVVAAPDGRIGFSRAFSGMLGGRWQVAGFVPPAFDVARRDAQWPAGEAELRVLEQRLHELETDPLRRAVTELRARHEAELTELRARHFANRERRRAARLHGGASQVLDQESRGDTAEKRRMVARHHAERAEPAARLAELDAERLALEGRRADRSRHFLQILFETYALASARGETRSLRALFAPDAPPGGAGDCAAPKLLGHAHAEGLTPIALAEVWWGAPPATGGRHAGVYYPACRGKCGPILAHMLDGLAADPAPVFGAGRIAAAEPRVVFEDDWLLVVEKPVGLLSVPGRSGALRDSVQSRLRLRYPGATGPLVVHRLDLDTSGLVLAAKDAATHAALQRLFARREIDKRYIAWLDGDAAQDGGIVDLALRVDLEDRPRQLHDPVHGKHAVTEWRVLARAAGRTRIAMTPRTGRTHQLRVHAAHALGIGVPIAGDRLYGREAERLLLHAEALAFVHPRTEQPIRVESLAPF